MTQPRPFADRIAATCADVAANFTALRDHADTVSAMAEAVIAALRTGHTVFFCGNGGSAADSQHLAAELLGRYRLNRAPLPAIALTVDTSALTAIGNDFGFDDIFERQLRGLAPARRRSGCVEHIGQQSQCHERRAGGAGDGRYGTGPYRWFGWRTQGSCRHRPGGAGPAD